MSCHCCCYNEGYQDGCIDTESEKEDVRNNSYDDGYVEAMRELDIRNLSAKSLRKTLLSIEFDEFGNCPACDLGIKWQHHSDCELNNLLKSL